MTYKDELNEATTPEKPQEELAAEQEKSISEDIKQIFNDDTLFGELMTEVVGEVVGNLAQSTIETLQEKFNEVFQSDDFSSRLGEQLGWKDTERQEVNTSLPERENETIER